jgi:hypothetical protein
MQLARLFLARRQQRQRLFGRCKLRKFRPQTIEREGRDVAVGGGWGRGAFGWLIRRISPNLASRTARASTSKA